MTVAIEGPPFEVTESGWGEFQIVIRITFQDPNQKPLQLAHFLRLYPLQDKQSNIDPSLEPNSSIKKGSSPSSAIVSENYEEIVFEIEDGDGAGVGRMVDILAKEEKYMDLSTSHRYQECKLN